MKLMKHSQGLAIIIEKLLENLQRHVELALQLDPCALDWLLLALDYLLQSNAGLIFYSIST